ncbi:MAG: ABC transporter ATP-binding protein [Pseudomonadales bacterium]
MLALRDIPLGEAVVDHQFASGAITVVLGRNRSGKSRLCRLIAGLETPSRGAVLLDGEDLTRVPPGRRSVAMVYQSFVNYPNLTVFENLASPLRARRLPAATVSERVRTIARQLELEPLLARLPAALSGGQQQRLAIGRALAKEARVLLLDEPLVNLDYKLREALEMELRALLSAHGVTVVYTTSDPRDAFNLGDSVLLLESGRVLQSGTPLAVYEQPSSLAAADLMSDPGVNRLREPEGWIAVRPEHLRLASRRDDDREFVMTVLSVETNGSETYLHGTVAGAHWVAKVDGLHRAAPDSQVVLHAPAAAVMVFPGTASG